MRDEIRKTLQGQGTHFLVDIAIGKMNASERIEQSTSRNMATDVRNLTTEMRKKYYIEENAARITIECIAELHGYTAPEVFEPLRLLPKIGDVVRFGDYDWKVLDVQDGKALLLSEDILEQRAYHPCYEGVTWEKSELRKHLNGDFYNLFDDADKARIVETGIENSDNSWYGVAGGADCMDKIFILSIEEADRYFGDSGDYRNNQRKKYDNGKWVVDADGWIFSNENDGARVAKIGDAASLWWLRTPGYSEFTAAYVSSTGNILPNGDRVCIGRGGSRPALWVRF